MSPTASKEGEAEGGTRSVGLALELTDLTAGYGDTIVVRNVSMQVERGRVLALLGPNGAGKTTTLRAIAGLVSPMAGEVRILDQDHTWTPPHRRAGAGLCMIPEGRGIFRDLTVRENLRLHHGPSASESRATVEAALAAFPILGERLHQTAGRLSGGQQQMLALARAYIAQPKLILLDEVSMGLAPIILDEIFQSLKTLAATGVTMVLVEQYVTRALAMADQVVLLNKGTVTYDGPPSDLDETEVVRGYLGAF